MKRFCEKEEVGDAPWRKEQRAAIIVEHADGDAWAVW